MICIQVFRKPGQAAFAYGPMDYRNVEDASKVGKSLAEGNPQLWGTFLYARPAHARPILLNEYHVLQLRPGSIRYRLEREELFGALDYIRLSGSHLDRARFPLSWRDTTGGTTELTAEFPAARAGKFEDMCKEYLARFIIQDNTPVLQFCNQGSLEPTIAIPLVALSDSPVC